MFISGFVLSYPTDRDVALEVTVDGAVPEEIPDATVLMIQELDNTGAPVPGSTIIVTEPVSTPPPATATTMVPVTTLPLPPLSGTPSPSPTRAGDWGWPAGLIGAGAAGLARRWSGKGGTP